LRPGHFNGSETLSHFAYSDELGLRECEFSSPHVSDINLPVFTL